MKKILLIGGLAVLAFTYKDKIFGTSTTPPAGGAGAGTPKMLTDAEAVQYGINNPGVFEYFKGDLEALKTHWFQTGFYEGRSYQVGGHKQ